MILKRLAIVAIVVAFNGGVVHGEEKRAKSTNTQRKSDPTNDQDSLPSVVIIDSGNTQPQPQQDSDSANNETQSYFRVLFAPNNLPTDALVVVGFITLYLLRFQAVETRKAAQAALLNAEALIKAERPWMVIDCGPTPGTGSLEYSIQAVNVGRTPAELCGADCVFAVRPMDFTEPPEKLDDPIWLPLKTFLVTDCRIDIGTCSVKFLIDQHIKSQLADCWDNPDSPPAMGLNAVFMYGRISYWDTFTDRTAVDAKPYVTQWLFRYDPYNKRLGRCAGSYHKNT